MKAKCKRVGMAGYVRLLAMLRAKAPDMGILILSGYPEEHYAINLIRQGASGYLNKECEPSEIVEAIRTIALGRRYLTPAVAELLAQQLSQAQAQAARALLRAPAMAARVGAGAQADALRERLHAVLPFALTAAQQRVVGAIHHAHPPFAELLHQGVLPQPTGSLRIQAGQRQRAHEVN